NLHKVGPCPDDVQDFHGLTLMLLIGPYFFKQGGYTLTLLASDRQIRRLTEPVLGQGSRRRPRRASQDATCLP
ncbi:MAG: hypothetical protein V3S14_07140, partial [Anaerolineae bacterium]